MSVTVTKLLPYVIIALFSLLSPRKSLHLVPQTPVLPDPLTVDLQFPSVFIDTSLSYTTAAEPLNNQASSHTDSTAASAKNQKSSNTKFAAKTPDYTCPNEIDEFDIFICKDCGGAVDATTYLNNGDPNAKCAGLEDGMWKDCPCYEIPERRIYPYRRQVSYHLAAGTCPDKP